MARMRCTGCARLQPATHPEEWSWDQIATMIAQYNTSSDHPLTGGERRAIPFVMARVPLYWIGEAGFLAEPIDAILSQTKGPATAQGLVEHASELVYTATEA